VEVAGRVLVDDEETLARNPGPAERLGRPLGVALLPVRVKWSSLLLGPGFGASCAVGLDPPQITTCLEV
jgi:hypothetical protein